MSNNPPKKYTVGYGKPPKSGQFQKGQSGNPMGKTKGSQNTITLLEKAIAVPAVINQNGQRKTVTMHEAIILQIVNKAASGDHKAIKEFLCLVTLMEGRQETNAPREFPITKEDQEIIREIALRSRKKEEDK